MEFIKLNSVSEELHKYCCHASDGDIMEVTEWKNGDGYDISIISKMNERKFSLTLGEFELLTVLINIRK